MEHACKALHNMSWLVSIEKTRVDEGEAEGRDEGQNVETREF
jgi:hypothetical protein